jgi:AAA+ ATPase superfamily predicted ATPase
MDYVEEGRADELMANVVRPGFNAFVGRAFERLARRALLALNARGALPARFERIGPWWSRGTEIDLVGLSEATGDLLACEVTWSALGRRDADRELDRLREKVAEIPWRRGERREHYCLVARRIDTVPEDGVLTLDAGDVMG